MQHLRVEFPTRHGTLVALDDVSFDIAPGEVLGVVGESGAGKSMTGNAVIRLLEPPGRIAGGEVRLGGKRIDNLPEERFVPLRGRHIGMIFQDPLTSLNPLFSIGDQLFATPHHPYSQMLLAAVPSLEGAGKERSVIQGEVPNPVHPPSGCAFHPRCPHANERCRREVPQLIARSDGSEVACHGVEEQRLPA
ncbi:MAG: ABC transporter ATP-binding protein [Halomonas sp. BM-2019]|nr:MAG: ABC transporter ATP-binding protein [Halomonas sp. BM-2019]